MAQEDFKIPGLKLFGKEVDNINGEKEETREQIWRDSHMLFKFEKGSGEDELPTDIDIDTIFLDYFSHENSSSSNQEEPLSRELVLVLPGIGMDLEVNKPFLQALAKTGRRVISLSVPGCGDSGDPSKEWRRDGGDKKNWKGDFSNYSTLLNRIIKELKAQGKIEEGEKFRVIGHSLGGVMGAEFTANNLDKVSSLDLIAPGGYRTEPTNPLHIYPKTTIDFVHKQGKEVLDRMIQNGKEEFPNIIRRMWLNNFVKKDKFGKSNSDEKTVGLLPRMLQRLWEAEVVLQGGLEENIGKVSAVLPVKIIVGEKDRVFKLHIPESELRAEKFSPEFTKYLKVEIIYLD